tara:strand:- start:102 stop:323 length:222 start_codon:yes stop_codon:yes gene_type:complete
MINSSMEREEGMTYDELIRELKKMKSQINHHRNLAKEMHILDTQYWFVQHQDHKRLLPTIELPNADTGNTRKG